MDEVRDIIIRLYAATLDGEGLDRVVADLVRIIGGHSAMMQVALTAPSAAGTPATSQIMLARNMDPDTLAQYASYWVRHDPWMHAGLARKGEVLEMDQVVSPEAYARSAMWNELRPEQFHALGMVLRPEGGQVGGFGIYRTRRQGSFAPSDVAKAKLILPHLRRAMAAMLHLNGAAQTGGVPSAELIDHFALPMAAFGADGRVLHVNAAMEAVSAMADGLRLMPAGEGLVLTDPKAARWLRVALAACGNGAVTAEPLDMAATRPSGLAPMLLHLQPMRPRGALLRVTVPGVPPREPRERLARLFGLTATEIALAMALLAGETAQEVALRRGVSIHTVRAQLRSLMEKTGQRRQAELVALLAQLAL